MSAKWKITRYEIKIATRTTLVVRSSEAEGWTWNAWSPSGLDLRAYTKTPMRTPQEAVNDAIGVLAEHGITVSADILAGLPG